MTDSMRQSDDLNHGWRKHRIDRRRLVQGASLLGVSIGALSGRPPAAARAQNGTPVTEGTGEAIQSLTREEYYALLDEEFAFEEPQNSGGQVIFSQTSDIATVNGLLTADYPTAYITTGPLFETLVTISPIDGQVVPALADSYEIAADGRTYTFHLNQDAKWHDGTDVTAEDVKFTFDVALDETSPNPRRSSILPVLESYRVIDDDTFEMVSSEPFATFLYDVPFSVTIMPKHIWESVPPAEWPNDSGSTGQDPARVVGTGPFKFQQW